jgi:quercetin dioxygenase-like cupin family protein
MTVNLDPHRPVAVPFADGAWIASPERGVVRKLLERDGGEIARATSIVRYAPGTSFPSHVHELGEELLVLEGVFSDEHGDHVAGTYVRNPPGSRHRPFSRSGCTIFVKLRQIAPDDRAHVVIGPSARWTGDCKRLHAHGRELVELRRLDAPITIERDGGIEILVVDGYVFLDRSDAPPWTWWRTPAPSVDIVPLGSALLWIKSGHLDLAEDHHACTDHPDHR